MLRVRELARAKMNGEARSRPRPAMATGRWQRFARGCRWGRVRRGAMELSMMTYWIMNGDAMAALRSWSLFGVGGWCRGAERVTRPDVSAAARVCCVREGRCLARCTACMPNCETCRDALCAVARVIARAWGYAYGSVTARLYGIRPGSDAQWVETPCRAVRRRVSELRIRVKRSEDVS